MSSNIVGLWRRARKRTIQQLASIIFIRGRDRLVLLAYRLRYPHVQFGTDVVIRGKLIVCGRGQVSFGDHTAIHGKMIIIAKGQVSIAHHTGFGCYRNQINQIEARIPSARVVIGSHSFFNGARISARTSIEFQPRCIVSDALIEDDDYHSIEINRWDPEAVIKSHPIYVGENVWIGSGVAILKGVTIGNNSVIGLGTVVRKSVPANCVVIGNPQQIVKQIDPSMTPCVPPL